jgi:methylase of polypeptide subunit release factors
MCKNIFAALSLWILFTGLSVSAQVPKEEGNKEPDSKEESELLLDATPLEYTDRKLLDKLKGPAREFPSKILEGSRVLVLPGVFAPLEAEAMVLPFMRENAALFAGKSVLEIGTGTGIISVYAAKLGATKVVSTDISEIALTNAAENAKRFGVASVMETRLVPESDMSAYSVIGPDEAFDLIISNPPYALDLDADENTAVTDRGDLGFSIVRGLETHLKPGGKCLLLYGSLFYHHVMVKFARYMGYEVRHHVPGVVSHLEVETLFNSYLAKLLEHEQMEPDALRFNYQEDKGLKMVHVRWPKTETPLIAGNSNRLFFGMIVIERKP